MDIHVTIILVPVVETRLFRLKDVVRLEADNVLKEATELVCLCRDSNLRTCILRHLNIVGLDG